MIRFFRTIRQQLMNENKTAKYLKYAVGEVLLVMIGILLALQVNNWNEGRKVEQQRLKLIENLKSDFQRNLESVEQIIADVEERKVGLETFLENATGDNSSLSVEELKTLAYHIGPNDPFEPSLGFYRAAISTGSIKLLEGSQLHNLFIEFENHNNRLQDMDAIGFGLPFDGGGLYTDIRKQLGASAILRDLPWLDNIPEAYELTDEEYRQFIAQKEVFAYFDMKAELKFRQLRRLYQLKDTTEEILATLKAL